MTILADRGCFNGEEILECDQARITALVPKPQTSEAMQGRLDPTPEASRLRGQTVEHTFGTLKAWMCSTHFPAKTLPRVSTEMSLHALAYNLKRAMQIVGILPLMQAMRA